MQERCIKLRRNLHNERAGLASARIAVQIHTVGVDIVVFGKISRQRDGLLCARHSPVVKLRGDDDHFIVVFLRLDAEILGLDIYADSLKIQSLPAGKCDIQCIRLRTVITIRNVQTEMNFPVVFAVKHVVKGKAAYIVLAEIDQIWREFIHVCLYRSFRSVVLALSLGW